MFSKPGLNNSFWKTDVTKPRLLDKVQIRDAGSDSAALQGHHAFLFDKTKNLLVIPVRAVTADPAGNREYSAYRPQVWYGAYVFGLTPQTGITLGNQSTSILS